MRRAVVNVIPRPGHAIAFRDPESLLRFTYTLQRELGLKVREDIKLDGVEVGEA